MWDIEGGFKEICEEINYSLSTKTFRGNTQHSIEFYAINNYGGEDMRLFSASSKFSPVTKKSKQKRIEKGNCPECNIKTQEVVPGWYYWCRKCNMRISVGAYQIC